MKKIYLSVTAIIVAVIITVTMGCAGKPGTFNPSREINPVTREEGSGTRDAFTELSGILEKSENGNRKDHTTKSAVTINSTEAVLTNISGDPHAIGYVSLGSMKSTVKPLKIDGIECTSENIKNGTYNFARSFNIATKHDINKITEDFINYILSSDGQVIVIEEGYVSVSDNGAYNGDKPSGKISIAGSSSVAPVMEKLKEAYEEVNPNAKIELQATDSSSGLAATKQGTCHIGMASRELKETESSLKSIEIAKDGIAIIVNPKNTVDNVTSETVKNIYTGKYTDWNHVIYHN